MGEGGSLMGGGIGSAGWRKKDGANRCISKLYFEIHTTQMRNAVQGKPAPFPGSNGSL